MRIMLVHPGASWSTHDVWCGLDGALKRADVEIIEFALDGRMQFAARYMDSLYKWSKGTLPKPTESDKLYLASTGMLERALRHMPDWVFIVSGTYLHPDALALLRRAGMKVASLLTESPYIFEQEKLLAERSTVAFTIERTAVEAFRPYCYRTFYWQHAMDAERHLMRNSELEAPAHDVVFVGTGFVERIDLLKAISWDGVDLGLYGSWPLLGSRSKLRRYVKGPIISNDMTTALYRKARIGLNMHRTSMDYRRNTEHISGAESMNPRCYELAATGTFFITDWRAEVEDIFGDVVPTFKTPKEAERLIGYYLEHEDERQAIAERLPGLVREETFDNRVRGLLRILEGIDETTMAIGA